MNEVLFTVVGGGGTPVIPMPAITCRGFKKVHLNPLRWREDREIVRRAREILHRHRQCLSGVTERRLETILEGGNGPGWLTLTRAAQPVLDEFEPETT